MNAFAEKISLQYGDAEISFYNIKIHHKHDNIKINWHSHRYFELHFLHKGQYTYNFEQGDVVLSEGEMLIIPPDCPHFPVVDLKDDNLCVVSLSVEQKEDEQRFYEALTKALRGAALKPIKFSANEITVFEYTELYRSVLGVLKLKQVAAEFTNRLFGRLLSNNPTISSGKASAVLIDTLVNTEGTTLDEIAKATNYSKRHVTRLIKKTYGMTFSELKRKAKEIKG